MLCVFLSVSILITAQFLKTGCESVPLKRFRSLNPVGAVINISQTLLECNLFLVGGWTVLMGVFAVIFSDFSAALEEQKKE